MEAGSCLGDVTPGSENRLALPFRQMLPDPARNWLTKIIPRYQRRAADLKPALNDRLALDWLTRPPHTGATTF